MGSHFHRISGSLSARRTPATMRGRVEASLFWLWLHVPGCIHGLGWPQLEMIKTVRVII